MKHTLITLPTKDSAEALATDLTQNTGAKCYVIATSAGWKIVFDDLNRINPGLDGKQNFVNGWRIAASRFAGDLPSQAKN